MFDFVRSALRSAIGAAEQASGEAVRHTPLHETRELEAALSDAVQAVHRSCDSLERHVAVIEALADSLPPLTESVTRLTDQLEPLLRIAAPLGSAEREVAKAEQEVAKVEHFWSRRHHPDAAETGAPVATDAPPPPPAS